MKTSAIAVLAALVLVACGSALEPDREVLEAPDDLGLSAGDSDAPEPDPVDMSTPGEEPEWEPPDFYEPDGVCQVGEREPCTCQTDEGPLDGERVCVDAAGVYSSCGCAYTEPYTGPTCQNESLECGYLIESEGSLAGEHCCTLRGQCGLTNFNVVGLTCMPRGVEPEGKLSRACGETLIPFIEVEDCCRPDNRCGLRMLTGENWTELGCLDRESMAQMLEKSYLLAIFLGINGTPDLLAEIEPRTCDYVDDP